MTRDPERLLTLSDLDDRERALLASLRNVDPPARAAERTWITIASRLAAVSELRAPRSARRIAAGVFAQATSAIVAAAQGGSTGAAAPVLKLVLGLSLGSAALGAGGYYLHERGSEPVPPLPAAVAAAPTTQAPTPHESVSAPAPTIEPARVRVSRDWLAAESGMLGRARSQLRRGDARASQSTLDKLDAQIRGGELVQERELLRIEVLVALGRSDEARRRARSFIDRYADSPYRAKLRGLLDQP